MSTKRYVRLVSPRCVNGKNEKNGKRSYSTTAPYTFSSNFRFSPVTEEYRSGNSRDGSIEDDDAYMGDEYESKDGYEDSSSNSDFQPKVRYTFTFHIFLSSSQGNGIDSASRFFPSFAKLNVQWSIVVVPSILYNSFIVLPCHFSRNDRILRFLLFSRRTIPVKHKKETIFVFLYVERWQQFPLFIKRLYRERKSRGNFFSNRFI